VSGPALNRRVASVRAPVLGGRVTDPATVGEAERVHVVADRLRDN